MLRLVPLLALAALGCGDKFSSEGAGGNGSGGGSGQAMGAAEIRLSPPSSNIPNIGTRTSCTAGSSGTYTYFLGSMPSGLTAKERVLGSRSNELSVDCSVVAAADSLFVSATIKGTDANSRHSPGVELSFSGEIPGASSFGDLESGRVRTADTGPLISDPFLSSCVLSEIEASAGELVALLACPVLVGDDAIAGCYLSGAVALTGCSR